MDAFFARSPPPFDFFCSYFLIFMPFLSVLQMDEVNAIDPRLQVVRNLLSARANLKKAALKHVRMVAVRIASSCMLPPKKIVMALSPHPKLCLVLISSKLIRYA
jgi:hypothetical protein